MDATEVLLAIGLWDSGNGQLLDVRARAALADLLADAPTAAITQARIRSLLRDVGSTHPSGDYVRGLTASLVRTTRERRPALELVLEAFRLEARRSAGALFQLDRFRHEEVGRTLILFFLKQRSYPEARSGRGRVDLVLVEPLAVIEAKVAPSATEVAAGIEQLADYMRSESRLNRSAEGYLVIFTKDARPTWWTRFGDRAKVNGREVRVIWVDIPTIAPSKLTKTRGQRMRP